MLFRRSQRLRRCTASPLRGLRIWAARTLEGSPDPIVALVLDLDDEVSRLALAPMGRLLESGIMERDEIELVLRSRRLGANRPLRDAIDALLESLGDRP